MPELVSVGHGSFVDRDGNQPILDRETILANQERFITALAEDPGTKEFSKVEDVIQSLVTDEVLAGALAIDWLLDHSDAEDHASITTLNNAMRWEYVLNLQEKPNLPDADTWAKGLDDETTKALEDLGLKVSYSINSGGKAYIEDCLDAGVPVPEAMWSAQWEPLGEIEDEFISPELQGELWRYVSESDPRGVCLALPRYPMLEDGTASDSTMFLGIICLGQETNKACFFDNPRGVGFQRDEEASIDRFVGGADLVPNGQGTCSDCHAGENPYIVHPEKAPFIGLSNSIASTGWHQPLVDASWPQNPGPTNLLDAVTSTRTCDGCHTSGSAGRFPELSTELPGYCSAVLSGAVRETMPPGEEDSAAYSAHIEVLQAACFAPPVIGTEVDFTKPDDAAFISPVQVIDPLYACSTSVAVRGAILDAEVSLLVNGVVEDTQRARDPRHVGFEVPGLVAGDLVTAVQVVDGATSAASATVTVRDHAVDYPSGLPAPEISPALIYECGDILAVRHVPGAKLTVFSNGGDPVAVSTSTAWTAVRPSLRPFAVDDVFSASISMCGESSPMSEKQAAVAAPDVLSTPSILPEVLYVGQELISVESIVHGATVILDEASLGAVGEFSTPVNRYSNYDLATAMGRPVDEGDQLISEQLLCEISPTLKTDTPAPCSELPAPRIRHPLVDDTHVVLTESVPGARIRVYDASGVELGDGSGTVIALSRAVNGTDNLTIAQSVGTCTSELGFQVNVRNTSGKEDTQ